jgi:hypothetical protein
MLRRVVTLKWTDVSEVRTASIIALMMEAVSTSETLDHFDVTTRRYIQEDSKLNNDERSVWGMPLYVSVLLCTS